MIRLRPCFHLSLWENLRIWLKFETGWISSRWKFHHFDITTGSWYFDGWPPEGGGKLARESKWLAGGGGYEGGNLKENIRRGEKIKLC